MEKLSSIPFATPTANFFSHLKHLEQDVYFQADDIGHEVWAKSAIQFMDGFCRYRSVLDVGCATGFCSKFFKSKAYTGITINDQEVIIAQSNGLKVVNMDMTFTTFSNEQFDLIFARHVLEHSPFPIITLMEWWRISSRYLFLVSPAPQYWTFAGRNHYSVADKSQLHWWLKRAGWLVIHSYDFSMQDEEYVRFWLDNVILAKQSKPLQIPTDEENKVVEYWIVCKKGEPTIE